MLKDLEKRAQILQDRGDPLFEIYQGWADDFDGTAGAAFNLAGALEYVAGILRKGGPVAETTGRGQLLEIARALYLLTHGPVRCFWKLRGRF